LGWAFIMKLLKSRKEQVDLLPYDGIIRIRFEGFLSPGFAEALRRTPSND
jgi:hypothetical protein